MIVNCISFRKSNGSVYLTVVGAVICCNLMPISEASAEDADGAVSQDIKSQSMKRSPMALPTRVSD